MSSPSSSVLLRIAQILMAIWAAWWSFFAIASSLGPPLTTGLDWAYPLTLVVGSLALAGLTLRRPYWAAPIAAVFAWAFVAWYFPTSSHFPMSTRLFVFATLPFPLLLAAGLIWGSRRVAPAPGIDPGHG